jgi:putative component of membrane protein insertase Oxa1/YidC/SpoIIIJ protein YidD
MRRYNVEDVRLTERLYERMLPWIANHPHVKKSASAEVPTCNKCGSTDLTRAGTYTAKVLTYQMYRCNRCHGLIRAGHRLGRVGHTVGVK